MVAQQFVALLQGAPVTYEMVEIEGICLRDHLIHETAPLLPRAAHKLLVGRRHKHKRESTDMGAEAVIFFPPALETLTFSGEQTHLQLLVDPFAVIFTPHREKLLTAFHQSGVGQSGKTLAEAQVVHRVEKVALPHAVVAQKAVYLRAEAQPGIGDVLEVSYGKAFEMQNL